MFDIGFWEIAVIGVIMLVVLGPERLPGVARTAGFWLSKMRRMVNDVKTEVKKEMDAAELKELDDARNQIKEAGQKIQSGLNANSLKEKSDEIQTDFKKSVDDIKNTVVEPENDSTTEVISSTTQVTSASKEKDESS